MSAFRCTSCGLCCALAAKLGFVPSEDGGKSCVHQEYDEDGVSSCIIYDDRPEVCRVPPNRHEANMEGCNQLQEEAVLGPEWRVK